MKKTLTTTYLSCLLAGGVLLGACNRPVAYFQRRSVDQYATVTAQSTTAFLTIDDTSSTPTRVTTALPTSIAPATAIDQLEAYVRSDAKLATSQTLAKRISYIKSIIRPSMAPQNQIESSTQYKATVLQKLMTKRVNAKINKHLAPNQPQKPMINGGLLGGSIVLVVVGLLLVLLTTGTVATIGLIAAIVGAIGVIFGLIAS